MNINRHNYEEYFILYMDNELGSEERRMVEAFLQQHPDLKEELDTLLQYKLVPDSGIVFEGKEELLKENGHSLITPVNYEEWLTLYIDNELTAEQKQLVDTFIAENPFAEKEFDTLQKAKLQPEQIVFTNKEALYRREEKIRQIPAARWRAAAAVLILALGLSAVLVLNKRPSGEKPEVAETKKNQPTLPPENSTDVQPGKNNDTPVAFEQKDPGANDPFVTEVKKQPNVVVEKKNDQQNTAIATGKKPAATVSNNVTINIPPVIKKDEQVIADNKPSNNLPQPLNNPNAVSNNKPENAVAYNRPDEINPVKTSVNPDVTNKTAEPSNIVPVSYNGNNDDAIFDQSDGKKNKNRGIFRKIVRTFEKRTNIDPTDDNKLLVAGLAIKLK